MAKRNRPMTDAEITRKFGVEKGQPGFEAAKGLARNRPDNAIFDLPMWTCPFCSREHQKEDYYDVKTGDEWECPSCERTVYITFVDHTTHVHVSTEPDE